MRVSFSVFAHTSLHDFWYVKSYHNINLMFNTPFDKLAAKHEKGCIFQVKFTKLDQL